MDTCPSCLGSLGKGWPCSHLTPSAHHGSDPEAEPSKERAYKPCRTPVCLGCYESGRGCVEHQPLLMSPGEANAVLKGYARQHFDEALVAFNDGRRPVLVGDVMAHLTAAMICLPPANAAGVPAMTAANALLALVHNKLAGQAERVVVNLKAAVSLLDYPQIAPPSVEDVREGIEDGRKLRSSRRGNGLAPVRRGR